MPPAPSQRKLILPAAISLAALLAAALLWLAQRELSSLPTYGEVPEFSLTDARGRPAGSKDLAGKVWVADLIFTRCTDTCPLQTAGMARLQAEFAGEKELRFVSITTDPAYDTPAVLAQYAARHKADLATWYFLTGEEKEIARLAREGFRLAFATRSSRREAPRARLDRAWAALAPRAAFAHHDEKHPAEISHSSRFVLVDRGRRIRGYYMSGEPESLQKLRRDIRNLLGR
ncbi:MAG: SCO family protein [Candidatus Tectomicrobia bacterium]|uniref:SCO family protein n=1 Tax=Tectimicrobiota bacterium TaxID=2528274 RepID=A0A932HZE8_UNCTE|nr:SCO family protein [Candidatus Tectomicrobia bacterium]